MIIFLSNTTYFRMLSLERPEQRIFLTAIDQIVELLGTCEPVVSYLASVFLKGICLSKDTKLGKYEEFNKRLLLSKKMNFMERLIINLAKGSLIKENFRRQAMTL